MTYVIAWKSENEVFLAADTALTSTPDPLTSHIRQTSFGQEHIAHEHEDNKIVEERVLKLFLRNNVGLAFAGNYGLALRVVATFYKKINKGETPRQALDSAMFSNCIQAGEVLQIAVGYYDNGPKLISLNATSDSLLINEDEEVVQLGNPLPIHRVLTDTWVRNALTKSPKNPQTQLAALLGIFQSYNLFSPQMERGIGGTFCGLFVNKTGGKWQSDILYIEYVEGNGGKHVGTCFRNDNLIINSPVIGESRGFTNWLPPEQSQASAYEVALIAKHKGQKLNRSAEYEYVVILAVEAVTVTVIEMKRKLKHALIWLKHRSDEKGEGTQITYFPKLKELMLRKEDGLKIFPYVAPNIRKIPENRILRKSIKYN